MLELYETRFASYIQVHIDSDVAIALLNVAKLTPDYEEVNLRAVAVDIRRLRKATDPKKYLPVLDDEVLADPDQHQELYDSLGFGRGTIDVSELYRGRLVTLENCTSSHVFAMYLKVTDENGVVGEV